LPHISCIRKSIRQAAPGENSGAAQVLRVFASASGPWILASVFENSGSYSPAFTAIALAIAVVAIAAWFVRIPKPEEALEMAS